MVRAHSLMTPIGVKLLFKPVLTRWLPTLLGSTIVWDMAAHLPPWIGYKVKVLLIQKLPLHIRPWLLLKVGPFALQWRKSCLPCPLQANWLHQTADSQSGITIMPYHWQHFFRLLSNQMILVSALWLSELNGVMFLTFHTIFNLTMVCLFP